MIGAPPCHMMPASTYIYLLIVSPLTWFNPPCNGVFPDRDVGRGCNGCQCNRETQRGPRVALTRPPPKFVDSTRPLHRALHGVGNPWGPRIPTGHGWKWTNFQGNLRGGAVTEGQQGSHNISQFLTRPFSVFRHLPKCRGATPHWRFETMRRRA